MTAVLPEPIAQRGDAPAAARRSLSLEERLIDRGVPEECITAARAAGRSGRESLWDVLVGRKFLEEGDLLSILGEHFGLPVLTELATDRVRTEFTKTIPLQYLKSCRIVPLDTEDALTIAVADPTNFAPLDELRRRLDRPDARIVLAPPAAILHAINFIYDMSRNTAAEFFQEINGESPDKIISEIEDTADLLDDTSNAPIIKLVNLLLSEAVKDRASDIHIEPYQNSLKVRYRIDGILYDTLSLPRRIQSPLVSRVKIMAKLNIAEKRLPQDGRIDVKIGERSVDIRVSVIPTAFGERVVLRLLDKTAAILDLADLGMDRETIVIFNGLIKSPYGIVLVTGPTGSGKTTTLYAALCTINHPEINIITIEDPIEYQIEGVGQIQINPKIDLTFATGLRSIVRQDPDVILVGEIRDRETAEIAIQSSLTGHLVFSTLHTNDAASAVTRLMEMGIEPFLVTSSVIAIVAQRLVRVLCPKCKEPYVPDADALASAGITPAMLKGRTLYMRRGCLACMNTGYHGRTGIFELLIMDENLKRLILKTSDATQIGDMAVAAGMRTLFGDGVEKVLSGITTLEEVLRVTRVLKRNLEAEIEAV